MTNKPNFPHFSSENEDCAKKQTQFKANSSPNKPNFGPISRVFNAKQTQFKAKQTQFYLLLQKERTDVRCRMSEITCLWQLKFNTDFDIIIKLNTWIF
jgi:hypothetical protein